MAPRLLRMVLYLVSDLSGLETIPSRAVVLAFDRLAADALLDRGIRTYFIDELLDWDTREQLEADVRDVLTQLARGPLGVERVAGHGLLDAALYDLRMVITDILRTAEGTTRIPEGRECDAVIAGPGCSPGSIAAAAAAIGVRPQRQPAVQPAGSRTSATRVANVLLQATTPAFRLEDVRLLAFPGAKVTPALEGVRRSVLRDARVGVVAFPGLVAGGAARLAITKRLPALVASGGGTANARQTSWPRNGSLTPDGALDGVLHRAIDDVLSRTAEVVARTSRATEAFARCRSCRAVVLPSTAAAEARVVREWARKAGLACAVVQHGVYSFRNWDSGDRDADVVLSWGPAVQELFAGGPDVRQVGTPGVARRDDQAPPKKRILIATTNAPTGSALGMHGFCELFVDAIRPSLLHLLAHGYEISFRPHPSERPSRYATLLGDLTSRIPISRSGSFVEQASRNDLVVSSFSSAAFEAAALGMPVAVWQGVAPLGVRERHLLPPLTDNLPGAFSDASGFTQLAKSLTLNGNVGIPEMQRLSDILQSYAVPFDADRFAAELDALVA